MPAPYDWIAVHPAWDPVVNPSAALSVIGRARHPVRDVAVLIVSRVAGVVPFATGDDGPNRVRIAGYALPDANGRPRMAWGEGGYDRLGRHGRYPITVRRGDSGSPVFREGAGGKRAVAIHFQGRDYGDGRGLVGVGEAVDDDMSNIIRQLETAARAAGGGG